MIRAELLQDATDALLVARALETDANFSRCTQFVRLLQDSNCGFQEKHNGDRRIIEKQGNSIKDYNRNGEPGKGLPECVKAVDLLRRRRAWQDGHRPVAEGIADARLPSDR